MKVRDMMTRGVLSVSPETPLKQVAALLVERRISGLPVVDASGRVVGVVSEADFLVKEGAEREAPPRRPWIEIFASDRERHADVERVAAKSAKEAMTSPPITIGPDEPLRRAARVMSRRAVNRLPVVEDDRLVGIITRADIVRVFARSDDELLGQASFALRAVDGLTVVGVRDGVVELSGTVQSEGLVKIIRSVVEHLDGVVAVDDRNVTWVREPQAVLG